MITTEKRTSLMVLGLMTVLLLGAIQVNASISESGMPVSTVQQTEGASSCIACHTMLEGPEAEEGIVHEFGLSAHADAGLDCSDCHGGNSEVVADLEGFDYTNAKGRGTGFRGVPDREEISAFCGRCHSDPQYMRSFNPQQRVDQEQLYLVSGHGIAMAGGNTRVATCVDCHQSHQILEASDPRSSVAPQKVPETCEKCHIDSSTMSGSGFSTGIGEEYNGSVHGIALLEHGDVGAPACNDCHGNHGAAPPGFSSVSAVCSQCHSSNATAFENSHHWPVFQELGEPQCEVCHGNHSISPTSDAMLNDEGVCSTCHSPGDAGLTLASALLSDLKRLEGAISEADSLLEVAHRKGIEVDEGQFTLIQAENSLVRGRASVHSLRIEALREVIEPGMEAAGEASETGKNAIEEFGRRRGGWEVFLLLCVVVIAAMWLMLKRFEGPGGQYPMREPE